MINYFSLTVLARCFQSFVIITILNGCEFGDNNSDNTDMTVKEPAQIRNVIKVLSFNIHAGKTVDGVLNLNAMADIINQSDADIVALQEVDVNTNRGGKIDMAKQLAEQTGMYYVFGEAMDFDGGQYGNAILSKINLSHIENIKLPLGKEPRAAIKANAMLIGGESINVISTHFDAWGEVNRINSSYQLSDKFAVGNNLSLLIGDLNDVPLSTTIQNLSANWGLTDPNGDVPTFPASAPTKKIDYIMFYPQKRWRVLDIQVINNTVSDHLPYLATLEVIDKS